MTEKESLCINTIRALSVDQVEKSKSGHPGAPMGCAPMAYLLWGEVMNYSPTDPSWINRDRFVLSNGHACALQYSMLHLAGYPLTIDDLKQFRQLGSKTPGHPESFETKGIEVCTGPLGQGISNAVGIAIAEKHLAATFNTDDHKEVFDHYTYVICGDGCLQEGVASEACSLAGHLGLGKLIVLYDDNSITIDGDTGLSFTEDVNKRYESYGWHIQDTVPEVTTADGLNKLREAIKTAKSVTDKPSIIKIKTVIGQGSPNKAGTAGVHGAPLGTDETKLVKKAWGLPVDKSFYVPDEVKEFFKKASDAGNEKRKKWEEMFAQYTIKNPEKAAELSRRFSFTLPDGVLDKLPTFTVGTDKDLATRKFSQNVLHAVGPDIPELMGGSADLTHSNLTDFKGVSDFQKDTPAGRYLRFGVREHGMAAICNGMFAHGGIRPYCATFLNFAGYALGAMRLSALSKFGIIYIMTHDSIGLGEDGPTHQPIEMLESLRSMPNIYLCRPADCHETSAAYKIGLTKHETPTVICCSRSTVKGFKGATIEKAMKGGYIANETEGEGSVSLIIISSGTEVGPCIDASNKLYEEHKIKTRVVSMMCQEVFKEQSADYQKSTLPGNIPTLSVEASSVHGWHEYSHAQIGMTTFGKSGKGGDVFKYFGFTAENICEKGKKLVEFYKDGTVPNLSNRPTL